MIDIATCPICQGEFPTTAKQRYNRRVKPTSRIFCSQECSAIGRSEQIKTGPVQMECAACGKTFTPSRNQRHKVAKEPNKKVACSTQCGRSLCGNHTKGLRPWLHGVPKTPKPKPVKPISNWIPYSGVGGSDFPALMNPF